MGMAASQARLLSITARIHDVEYQAQSIQNAKIQLATKEDQAYREYNEALEATTLTMNAIDTSTGEKAKVPATFNNLCSRNRLTPASQDRYAIRNKDGKLLVEDEIEEGYRYCKSKGIEDPYQFALYMMNIEDGLQSVGNLDNGEFARNLNTAEEKVYQNLIAQAPASYERLQALHEDLEKIVGEGADSIYDASNIAQKDIEQYEEKLAIYRKELYKNAVDIDNQLMLYQDNTAEPKENYDTSLFQYYVSIYNQIEFCRGCVSVDDYDGFAGNANNDSDWLQAMVQSGQFTIEIINEDKKTGKVELDATSPSSDSCLTYTQASTIDNRVLAKAEAEYEDKLRQIDKKDQKFDLDLSKLETERTALTTEYESVKKVIEDNIDRTFGIFS